MLSSPTTPLGMLLVGPQALFVLAGPENEPDANNFFGQRPPGHFLLRLWPVVVGEVPPEVPQEERGC